MLNGWWNIIVDEQGLGDIGLFGGPYYREPRPGTGMELVEHRFDAGRQLRVPGDWNTQEERLFRYRGVVWYQRDFELQKEEERRYFLHFDGVNYAARVYLNGQPLAEHRGGYVAFSVELSPALRNGRNFLVVQVDAALDQGTLPAQRGADFFKYGGITRDVRLLTVPETFIRRSHFYLQDRARSLIAGWVQLDGPDAAGAEVELRLPELGIRSRHTADPTGRARFVLRAEGLELWSPERPRLYRVELRSGTDRLEERIGFRSIAVRDGQILLNGEPVYLRGVSMHDESPLKRGVAFERVDAAVQLGLVKELHGNFVRLAHYPHNEYTLRLADELGLLVWSEIPLVSLIDWENPDTLALARGQLADNLYRDLNRASVILWSLANESLPQSAARLQFLRTLAADARRIDESGRLLTAALLGDFRREFGGLVRRLAVELLRDPELRAPAVRGALQALAAEQEGESGAASGAGVEIRLADPLGETVDVIGYNEYFGWYYSTFLARQLPVDEARVRRAMFRVMPDIRFSNVFGKPMIISEFGAGAKKGFTPAGQLWSEEYQARVYRHQLDMLRRSPAVRGSSPWILKDFRSPSRPLRGIQDFYNRKGIVTERGEKKQAFFVLQDFYKNKIN